MGDQLKSVYPSDVVIELESSIDSKRAELSRSGSNDSDPEFKLACVICKSKDVEFTNFPCECCSFCKKCAMKVATGGKCKVCKSIFSGMRTRESMG